MAKAPPNERALQGDGRAGGDRARLPDGGVRRPWCGRRGRCAAHRSGGRPRARWRRGWRCPGRWVVGFGRRRRRIGQLGAGGRAAHRIGEGERRGRRRLGERYREPVVVGRRQHRRGPGRRQRWCRGHVVGGREQLRRRQRRCHVPELVGRLDREHRRRAHLGGRPHEQHRRCAHDVGRADEHDGRRADDVGRPDEHHERRAHDVRDERGRKRGRGRKRRRKRGRKRGRRQAGLGQRVRAGRKWARVRTAGPVVPGVVPDPDAYADTRFAVDVLTSVRNVDHNPGFVSMVTA